MPATDGGHRFFTYSGSEADLDTVARHLREGDVVALPTETVYGLGANALDEVACRRIFEAKGRPLLDPLIVHVLDTEAARTVAHWNDRADRLAAACWPGPLTLVLPKTAQIPALVTAGLDTVAIRSPRHPLMRSVLQRTDFPIAAPSANPFGYVSPTRAEHVAQNLGDRIHGVLDGGPCEIGLESSIVDISKPDQSPRLLRPGFFSAEDLSEVLGETVLDVSENVLEKPQVPGQLPSHYSPHTHVKTFAHRTSSGHIESQDAVVFFQRPEGHTDPHRTFWLSENGDPATAARSLFSLLRSLDTQGFRCLHVELAPDVALGRAINDRLQRAAAKG